MANPEHVAILDNGVKVWNKWRRENPEIKPDLSNSDFSDRVLSGVNLSHSDINNANFARSDLSRANLVKVTGYGSYLEETNIRNAKLTQGNFRGAWLETAYFSKSDLSRSDFSNANLRYASLWLTNLQNTNLVGADLNGAWLDESKLQNADLMNANLVNASIRNADLASASLIRVNLTKATLQNSNLTGANLLQAHLAETNFNGAVLVDCNIWGISAWGLSLEGAIQANLSISGDEDNQQISVDNIEVAQFIYLLLHNEKLRDIIDTITSKVVLILGRFTPDRKAVLDAIRDELRRHNYSPILFDFEKPASRDLTETVSLLARMARFIIADLTDPMSIPHELATIVPTLRSVPVVPIIESDDRQYGMFADLQHSYPWVLPTYHYADLNSLLSTISVEIIGPAEEKVLQLRGKA